MTDASVLHRTRRFDALGWSFTLASDHAQIVEYVTSVYAGLASAPGDGPSHDYQITSIVETPDVVELTLDGERLDTDEDAPALVTSLVHDVNRQAIASTALLAAHAGGVVGASGAVVLPASMASGKTTLTAGLVRAGFGYLTDEAVAIDWDTLELVGYAKPLSLDPGSWPLFPEAEPQVPFGSDGYKREQWQVPADALRPGAFVARARASAVVFPAYREHHDTELLPLSRGEALVELAKNTFGFRDHGRRALVALAQFVESVECYRLMVGDLDEAVDLVSTVVRPS